MQKVWRLVQRMRRVQRHIGREGWCKDTKGDQGVRVGGKNEQGAKTDMKSDEAGMKV